MMKARKKRRAARPAVISESAIYAGNRKIGDVFERAGRLRATGAHGEKVGVYRRIGEAMAALVSVDRSRG